MPGLTIDRTRQSPNFGVRAASMVPDAIVLHYTGMKDGPAAVDWLCNSASQVSCHYVVAEDGRILQLVEEDARAWHAGRSVWRGVADMNSASIGIEIVNGGHDFGLPDFPAAQIEAVIALCRDIQRRRAIPPERVLGHSDIAPGRKRDPGERFPWDELHRHGVGYWIEKTRAPAGPVLRPGDTGRLTASLQDDLQRYGYGLEPTGIYDASTETVVRAFQLHFRPWQVDGLTDAETRDRLGRLLGTLQVA